MSVQRTLPPSVVASRLIAFVQGALGGLTGLLLLFGGSAVAQASGLSGSLAATAVIAIGVILLGVSGLLIWGAVGLGRLSPAARAGVLVYEWVSLLLGLAGLTHPGLGLLGLMLAGVVVYFLQFDARTKAAFGIGTAPPPPRATRLYGDTPLTGQPAVTPSQPGQPSNGPVPPPSGAAAGEAPTPP